MEGAAVTDLKLFRLDADGRDVELRGSVVALEVELQRLIEANMEAMLGIRLLASEYPTGPWHRGRVDSLGLDENGTPVIVEYKKGTNSGIVSQAVSYLTWLCSARHEFEALVRQKLGAAAAEEIDWRPEPDLGHRLHLCADLGRDRVRRLRGRHVLPQDRGLGQSTNKRTQFVLDALDMGLWQRDRTGTSVQPGELIHHSDAGSQYTSFRLAAHLAAEQIAASIGSVGDAYDNALMESTIGLYKTELIKRQGPWRTLADIELAKWVDWYNHTRLHGELGHIPPAEHEAAYYLQNPPNMHPWGPGLSSGSITI